MTQRTLRAIVLFMVLVLLPALCLSESNILYIYGKAAIGIFENKYLEEIDPDFCWESIEVSDGNNSAKSMALQMQTNNDCFDLYQVGYAYCGLTLLNEKGFCLDLSQFPAVTDIVSQMHPYLREAVWKDDKLFAFPVDVSISGWAYDEELAKDMGIQECLPTTYDEFFDLMEWWLEEGGEQYPDYEFILGPSDYRSYLISKVIYDYVNYCTFCNKPLDFSMPIIVGLLERIDHLDTGELNERERAASPSGYDYEKRALFIPNTTYCLDSDSQIRPIHLGIDEDDRYFIADIHCFAVNPHTARVDMAVKYIETFVANFDDGKMATLFFGAAVPQENPNYATEMEENAQEKQRIEADDSLSHVEREELLQLNARGKVQIENNRWLVTQEQIDTYEALIENTRVRTQNILESNSTNGRLEIEGVVRQYIDGALTLPQFVQEANRITNMIITENQ